MIHNINQPYKILLIFADSTVKGGMAFPEELQSALVGAAERKGVKAEFYITKARSLSFFVSNRKTRIYDHANRRDLKDYDFVYFRKAGTVMQQMLACASYLRYHGIPFADAEIGQTTSRNKLSQMFLLRENGISVPTTLFVRNKKRLVRLITTTYKDDFTWPVVAKATGGTRGDANFLVETPDKLLEVLKRERRHFLVQSYIPNEGDYRVLVIHNKVRGLIKRVGVSGSHLNNTSKDGSAEWLPISTISAEYQHVALRSAQVFGRDIAGVDLMFDKNTGKGYILEVNRAPQVEGASFTDRKAEVLVEGMVELINDYAAPVHQTEKTIIGRREYITLPQFPSLGKVIAKVDTGAYSNTMHVEYLEEREDSGRKYLRFSPVSDTVDVYETEYYSKKVVTSSNGESQERYLVDLHFVIGGKEYIGQVTLSKRDNMMTPILIGRKFLKRYNFIVDPKKRFTQ